MAVVLFHLLYSASLHSSHCYRRGVKNVVRGDFFFPFLVVFQNVHTHSYCNSLYLNLPFWRGLGYLVWLRVANFVILEHVKVKFLV